MTRPGLFITGTDTGVGKTAVAASIARRLAAEGVGVGVLKPVATGSAEDAERLREAVDRDVPLDRISPLIFQTPAAPSVAARIEGVALSLETILQRVAACWDWWETQGRAAMLVEGVGGWLCPIAERATVSDLAVALDLPVLIVARRALGTLNHTLLTVEAVRRRGVRIAGLVLVATQISENPEVDDRNPAELMRFLNGVPILADVPYTGTIDDIDSCMVSVGWTGLLKPGRSDGFRAAPGDYDGCPRN
jgi:dethiobiotin synthetase